MFNQHLEFSLPCDKNAFPFGGGLFAEKLLFIVIRPCLDFDYVSVDMRQSFYIPRTTMSYEFFVGDTNPKGILFKKIVIKEFLGEYSGHHVRRSACDIVPITQENLSHEQLRASYVAKDGTSFAIRKIDKVDEDAVFGYNVFAGSEFVGFFSEFGSEEYFSYSADGLAYFDFDMCSNLVAQPKSIINTRDYHHELSKDCFIRATKANYGHYIYNLFPMSNYTIIGVADAGDMYLLKSNSLEDGKHIYYEFSFDDLWLSKVSVKNNAHKKGYYTTYVNAYLGDIRDYSMEHELCGLSFELGTGFTVDEHHLDRLFRFYSVGGEIRHYREVPRVF